MQKQKCIYILKKKKINNYVKKRMGVYLKTFFLEGVFLCFCLFLKKRNNRFEAAIFSLIILNSLNMTICRFSSFYQNINISNNYCNNTLEILFSKIFPLLFISHLFHQQFSTFLLRCFCFFSLNS